VSNYTLLKSSRSLLYGIRTGQSKYTQELVVDGS
jgi:hypothetical protein